MRFQLQGDKDLNTNYVIYTLSMLTLEYRRLSSLTRKQSSRTPNRSLVYLFFQEVRDEMRGHGSSFY